MKTVYIIQRVKTEPWEASEITNLGVVYGKSRQSLIDLLNPGMEKMRSFVERFDNRILRYEEEPAPEVWEEAIRRQELTYRAAWSKYVLQDVLPFVDPELAKSEKPWQEFYYYSTFKYSMLPVPLLE